LLALRAGGSDRSQRLDPPYTIHARRAFSLLEVIVSMAIFLMSIVVLGQIVTMGGERAMDIDQQGEAAMLAQSKMAEVIWGAVPLSSQSDQSFDETSDYKWAMTADQNSTISNLWNVTVTVSRERSDGSKIESVLSQMILDPSQRGSSQDTVSISGSSGGGTSGASAASKTQQQQTAGGPQQMPAAGAGTAPKTGTSGAGSAPKTTTPGGKASTGTTTPGATAPKTTTPSSAPKTTTPSSSKAGGK
jgi:prepilin-type N-terminal cleavage/methylation domain-containing protein